jgi:hypothetical protein
VQPGGVAVDVLQVFGDFVLACLAHGKVDTFLGSGVEILLLDGEMTVTSTKINVLSFLMESGFRRCGPSGCFQSVVVLFLVTEGLPQSTNEKIDNVVVTMRLLM